MRGSGEMQEPLLTMTRLKDPVPAEHPLGEIRVLVNVALLRLNGLRFAAVGLSSLGNLLVVVYTCRDPDLASRLFVAPNTPDQPPRRSLRRRSQRAHRPGKRGDVPGARCEGDVPARAHCARCPGSGSGARFARAGCLWPGPFPPSPPPPVARPCSATSQVLRTCPTSLVRTSSAYVDRLPDTARCSRRNKGSPGSRAGCLRTCAGSLTARGRSTSRDIDALRVAFRFSLQRRHPRGRFFRGSIPGPHVPLSTLQRCPCEQLRVTRGRCGSLRLHRMKLSFTTPRRFSRRTRS